MRPGRPLININTQHHTSDTGDPALLVRDDDRRTTSERPHGAEARRGVGGPPFSFSLGSMAGNAAFVEL